MKKILSVLSLSCTSYMFSLAVTLSLIAILPASAQAGVCQKPQPPQSTGDLESCYSSPQLKWALSAPSSMNADLARAGAAFEPALTPAEMQSSTVFCQYFAHRFSSPGSAKFLCAKTNSEGQLLDQDGQIVPEAVSVSTADMKLKVQLNGETVLVDEGVMLDKDKRPLVRTTEKGRQHLIKIDELKVKYFVDANQYSENQNGVKRQDIAISFDGRTVNLRNVFVGPQDISNPRWNEVFAEVAGTRLFWALGIPADIMVSIDRLVCFGCESHPKDQKGVNLSRTSIYNRVALEKKMKGAKLDEQFSFARLFEAHLPAWSPETKRGLEHLVLASRLIGFSNTISLQNRLQCLPGQLDKKTLECRVPVAQIQDIGSSWAGRVSESEQKLRKGSNPRGSLKHYQQEGVFAKDQPCRLVYAFGLSRDKNAIRLKGISEEGLNEFRQRLKNLTPEVIEAIFESAHFDDMEPALRDAAPGSSLADKRRYMISQWTQSLQSRIDEINTANCSGARLDISK